MKKLMMTVVAGSLCAAFGGAYAQGTPGPSGAQSTPTSKTGVQTPKQVDDNRMAQGGKGGDKSAATGAGASTTGASTTGSSTMGSSTTGSSTTGTAGTSGASTSTSSGTDMGTERKGRRAARREKG